MDLSEEFLNKDVWDLEISVRASNQLYERNLDTIGKVLRADPQELRRSRFGRNSLREIDEALKAIDERLFIGCLAPESALTKDLR